MTFKEQWNTIKSNWVIALVLLLIVLVPMFSGTTTTGFAKSGSFGMPMMESAEMAVSAPSDIKAISCFLFFLEIKFSKVCL